MIILRQIYFKSFNFESISATPRGFYHENFFFSNFHLKQNICLRINIPNHKQLSQPKASKAALKRLNIVSN
ncbi:hypothetical protein BpHYR1_047564 [Brachionus plicatilis]|uniref:Uncharacterized protein n=1 Tax=Brachionus plicatilis TaxID=10195 RepID=A0A3M7SRT5_BRAPC|nr:hypothetical protein BpHYR1_047564 [Brachionus plicatilis]